MNALMITSGTPEFASSRMRCFWPAQYLPGVDVIPFAQFENDTVPIGRIFTYDTVVFQKVGAPAVMADLRKMGKRVIYDLCDPVHWFSPDLVRDMLQHIDVLTASTDALASDLAQWANMPVSVIHDGLDLQHHYRPELVKQHAAVERLRFAWYGIYANRIALAAGMAYLERMHCNGYNIELLVLDEQPTVQIRMPFSVIHRDWSLGGEIEALLSADVALLPPYPGPWGKLKSENKKATAWALGLPVVDGQNYGDMVEMLDPERRTEQGIQGRQWAERAFDCRLSAAEWAGVL